MNTGQGSQFTGREFVVVVEEHDIAISMGDRAASKAQPDIVHQYLGV